MLKFKVFENGAPAKSVNLDDAYLVGSDRVPLRVKMEFAKGEIRCDPRARGAAALSIMWPVEGIGRIMLETTRLLERTKPYNLHVELARGQLMRINQKREDWGLYDFTEGESIYQEIDAVRDQLITAITADDDVTATRHGDAAIAAGVKVGETVGIFHSDIILKRRHEDRKLARRPLGCGVDVSADPERWMPGLVEAFDFASLPFSWRALEPKENKYQTKPFDQWLRAIRHHKMPVRGRSLLSFKKEYLPSWVASLPKDYEQVRECVSKHLKYTLKQFGGRVRAWEVISGLHAHNTLHLSFEQIMELTRMSAILVKQMAPRSTAIVGIVSPWGEYYAHDARSIPPALYAEMVVQSGINFDAFGLEVRFGGGEPGLYVRDMMQISSMLDQFGKLGKPVHVTAAGVSSGGSTEGGTWHGEWSEQIQAQWLRDFYQIALSKPFVETVCWQILADDAADSHEGGVWRADLSHKPAYEEILSLRRRLQEDPTTHPALDPSHDEGLET